MVMRVPEAGATSLGDVRCVSWSAGFVDNAVLSLWRARRGVDVRSFSSHAENPDG
jgi:hypothetical protein